MNLFDASEPKPPQEKDPPAPPAAPAQRVPKEVLQGFPGLESAVKRPLVQRILLWFIPNLTAFFASFCIMVIELVASRVIARHLGSSLYTWTSVIGIVLLGITLGNLLGGRLADWFRPTAVLAVLFLLAAGACVSIPIFNDWVNDWPAWKANAKDANWFVSILHSIGGGAEADPDKKLPLPWSSRIFGHVLLVFLLPSTVLGTIGPVVAKMALDQGRKIGSTVGNVYAWGALGSIVGTFFTGFYLIAKLGTVMTFLVVGSLLCLVGILFCLSLLWSSSRPRDALIAFFAVFWAVGIPVLAFFFLLDHWEIFAEKAKPWPFEWVRRAPGGAKVPDVWPEHVLRERADLTENIVYVDESHYSYIKVDRDSPDEEGGKEPKRDLVLDNLIHAHYVPDDPTQLEYEYEDIYKAITHRCQPTGEDQGKLKALFIGGGGYIFPRYLRAIWPDSYIEIAEIDPAVTRADVMAFGLDKTDIQIVTSEADRRREGNPFWIYHLDARNHVEDLIRKKDAGEKVPEFDFIYGDAFNDYAVPFHLTTREFNQKVMRLLKPDSGVYMINIIDVFDTRDPKDDEEAARSRTGQFLGAVFNTFRETFGEDKVYLFGCNKGEPSTSRDTYIVVGSLRKLQVDDLPGAEEPFVFEGCKLTSEHLKILTDDRHAGGDLLTDDKAPVENLLQYVVNSRKW